MNASDPSTPDTDPSLKEGVESSESRVDEPTADADHVAGSGVGNVGANRDARAVDSADAVRPELPTPHTVEELATEPSTRCLNCDAELPGPYCPACGQRAERLRQPVHLFVRDAGTELFGIDGRVWRTLATLLIKPGALTLAYLEGRRRRYLTPLRVYLVATLTFFVLLTLIDPVGGIGFGNDGVSADSTMRVSELRANYDVDLARYDSLRGVGADSNTAEAIERRVRARLETDSLLQSTVAGRLAEQSLTDEEREEIVNDRVEAIQDSLDLPSADKELRMRVARGILEAMPSDTTVRVNDLRAASAQMVPEVTIDAPDFLPDWYMRSSVSRQFSEARSTGQMGDASSQLLRSALRQMPTVLFFLLPLYALLLKLLYVRRDWFYSEHLVFGLHVHAYAFFAGVLMVAVSIPGWWGGAMNTFYLVTSLSIPVYFVIAQKRVYGQGWRKTVFKASILGTIYFFLIATAGLVLSLALAVVRG